MAQPKPNGTGKHHNGTAANPSSAVGNGNKKKKRGATFASQQSLPRLPIPTLDETMDKLLEHLKPLHDEDDVANNGRAWMETQAMLEEFKTNDGPKLQQMLLDYDQEGKEDGTVGSYVEAFWNDAYLVPDASVVLNLNPFFVLEDSPDPKIANEPILRAASLCFAAVKMVSQLRKEEMAPDVIRGRQLCMDQFRFLFGVSRVPRKDSKDTVHVYDQSNHIAVLRRGQMFYFQVLWPNGDVAVDDEDLRDILRAIDRHASATPVIKMSKTALGVLTSLSRKEWARARDDMIDFDADNREALQIVDSALFVLVLDDYIPKSINDAAANMLHGSYELMADSDGMDVQVGTCCNRWYDKLQIIVCGDGTAGINFEHSAIDGHTALRFVSDVYAETVISFAKSITKSIQAHGSSIANVIHANVRRAATVLDANNRATLDVFPKRVPFALPDNVLKQIYYAETALGDQISASDTKTLEFKGFGKLFVVGNKFSPDSVVQMSMMLAYYKLYGKVVCTYEPVMTKTFYHGRTEGMRSATAEVNQLCKLWCDESATTEQKVDALRVATTKHSTLIRECAKGKGVDRHLYALKCIAEKEGVTPFPKFFDSEPWKRLNHTILSTSNCGNPSLRLFGFGPVVSDGFGVGYIIKDHSIQYSISSKHRQTKRYTDSLQSVLMEIHDMLKKDSKFHVEPKARPTLQEVGPIVGYDTYGDIWGESTPVKMEITDAAIHVGADQVKVVANSDDGTSSEEPDEELHTFPNLLRQESLEYSRLSRKSKSLSLDDFEGVGALS